MPTRKIILESNIVNDKYTEYVYSAYDIQNNEKTITEIPTIPMEELKTFNWNIGVILGNSGSGKSTLLKHIGNLKEPTYDFSKCIISQFPQLSEKEVTELFCSVGLSSVPTWLRKPNELSNGEKARLDLCWLLVNYGDNEIILCDEFSSVVNRMAAHSMSYALQRYIRKYNKKIILASCHFDIVEWLRPDWIFNLNKEGEIERLIYKDDEEYQPYNNINLKDVLSESERI